MPNMPTALSWVELHGALTHFPIVLLLTSVACDLGALVASEARRASLRQAGLVLLAAATASCVPALFSGYMTGRGFSHPPLGFKTHWIAAVATSGIAAMLLGWRTLAHDRLGQVARVSTLALALAGAAAVSFTGYMGGEMVFGGAPPVSDTESPRHEARREKPNEAATNDVPVARSMEAASGNMNLAAERLGLATERLALAMQSQQPSGPVVPPRAPPAAAPARASVAVAGDQSVSRQLQQVDSKLSRITAQLEMLADRLPALASVQNKDGQTAKVAKAAPSPKGAAATGAAATPSADYVALVDSGARLFRSADLGCISCHKMEGDGGTIGPDLTHEARRQPDTSWHVAHLKDPASKSTGSRMPPYDNLKADQLQALAAYLASRK